MDKVSKYTTGKPLKIAIVGAGRTGRGFIARLLRERAQTVFFDKNEALIGQLRLRGEFRVHYYDSDKIDTISGYEAYATGDPACRSEIGRAHV